MPDYQPSDFVKRAIAASVDAIEISPPKKTFELPIFRRKKVEPLVNQSEQLAAEIERMLSATRPAEVVESKDEKKERLIYWKKWTAPLYVNGGIATKSTNQDSIMRFDEYLSMFPEDSEAKLWRDILEAIFIIKESDIRNDEKFDASYSGVLSSLTVSKDGQIELLPFVKLDELAKPLIELAGKLKTMVEVSEKEEGPELTLAELMDIFLSNGLVFDKLKLKSANGTLAGLGSYKRQTALDLVKRSIDVLGTMEGRGIKFINVAGNKIPIGEIRAKVEKDLENLGLK